MSLGSGASLLDHGGGRRQTYNRVAVPETATEIVAPTLGFSTTVPALAVAASTFPCGLQRKR